MAIATAVPQTITIKDAATRLGVHENTIRNWIDRGLLDGYRTPTGQRKLVLASVQEIEGQMYISEPEVVEVKHKVPQQRPGLVKEADRYL